MMADRILHPLARITRISVRVFIVPVLVAGAGLGWVVRTARVQREVVMAITRAGGSVQYSWEWNQGVAIPPARRWMPERIVKLVGPDCLGHVMAVRLSYCSTPATDAALVLRGSLTPE
jgi:hypothetical protein